MKKRSGVAAAITVFCLTLMGGGLVSIFMDQLFQFFTTTGQQLCSAGCYSTTVTGFYQALWFYGSLVLIIFPASIWLFLRAQESGIGQG